MYFDNMKNLEEIKNRYRILSKRLHPDVGGDKTIMQEINREYENAISPKPVTKTKVSEKNKPCVDERYKLEKVFEWATNNPSFDTTFVYSLLDRLDSGKDLTYPQLGALNNIIRKFKIEIK